MSTDYNIWAWSNSAPIDNATADAQINWAEGQDPATVNNSARAMMTAIAKYTDARSGNIAVAGSANAIIITTGQAIDAAHQAVGFRICFRAAATNTGAATVAVDGLSAVAIKRPNDDALSAGDIIYGAFYDIAFDGTNYRLMGPGASLGGTLAGNNTWTGNNYFHGTTSIGQASDGVAIKGTVVSPFSASLMSNTSASAWRIALGIDPAPPG